MTRTTGNETTLDADDRALWRQTAHEALDLALDHLDGIRSRNVWQPVPGAAKAALIEPLPTGPQGLAAAIAAFKTNVLPYGNGNTHPRFLGWVHGSGTEAGVVAEMLAAAFNANLGGREHAAIYVETQVIDWMRALFGFPASSSGLLVSGTSMATVIGLAAARQKALGTHVRTDGAGAHRLTAYTSAEAHSAIAKAFELLGLGSSCLRRIATRDDFTMDTAALQAAIAHDRAEGRQPFAIIATAGTVNTGATDDLASIARIAAAENLWLHIDGAFGAMAMLSPRHKARLAGIERADSLAFDFHKWLHVPYDAGCILVRDRAMHLAAFSSRPDYLTGAQRGLAAGEPWLCEYGPELSRGFRALKVWMTLKTYGTDRLGASIAANCDLARDLGAKIAAANDVELLAPVALNIVCFRLRGGGGAPAAHDAVNAEIVMRLHEQGIAAPSMTRVRGRVAVRVNITNHRTTAADLDAVLEGVRQLGRDIARGA